jgi:peptidoglycan hydrolase-like protein with peptidoglycan-binding domain
VPDIAIDQDDRRSRAGRKAGRSSRGSSSSGKAGTPQHAVSERAVQFMRGETTLTRILAGRLMRSPASAFATLVGCGVAGAILFNMMLMQPERHRAPMFTGNPLVHAAPLPSEAPLPPARPATIERDVEALRRAELLRELQVELGRRGYYVGEPDSAQTQRTTQAIREFQAAAGLPVNGQPSDALLAAVLTSNLRAKDQILGLIRSSAGPLDRPETVAAVQRALTKIGLGPLKDDGQFGPGTRAALDRFEKERRLPPRGDNPARTLRELALASGVAID